MDNMVLICAVETEHAAREHSEEPLEVRARAAMVAAKHHWGVTDEDKQFLAACEGLARTCSDEERERLETELRKMQRAVALINALTSGISVDWADMDEQIEAEKDDEPSLGLQKMWREVCAA